MQVMATRLNQEIEEVEKDMKEKLGKLNELLSKLRR